MICDEFNYQGHIKNFPLANLPSVLQEPALTNLMRTAPTIYGPLTTPLLRSLSDDPPPPAPEAPLVRFRVKTATLPQTKAEPLLVQRIRRMSFVTSQPSCRRGESSLAGLWRAATCWAGTDPIR
jgi:hypothetical protein